MTDALEAGLRLRLRRALRRIETQHLHLRALFGEVEGGVRGGASAAPTSLLTRLRDALRAHFELEEQVVFPALHGLSPSAGVAIEALEREHERFLALLDGMLEENVARDADGLARLRAAVGEHERREEQLLEGIAGLDALRKEEPG